MRRPISYLRYWPLALVAIGVLKMLQARDGGGAFAGLLFAIVGVWLQAEELNIIHIRHLGDLAAGAGDLWGLSRVAGSCGARRTTGGRLGRRDVPDRERPRRPPVNTPSRWTGETSTRGADANSTLSAIAVLGGVSRGNNSRAFRGADLLAIMGGLQIDLRQAAIHGEAVMDVFVMWGGVEIRVPEDWTVSSRIVPLMAGVEDKTRPPQGASTHHLILRGFALMGGVGDQELTGRASKDRADTDRERHECHKLTSGNASAALSEVTCFHDGPGMATLIITTPD